ncbi:DNA polymerase III subunit delta [Legionella micdadei]|uniref:DNA polymerase III subunit delta n=1 Tax=Legionella micdadei TaxID=451 RepID=A0A098GFT7_LEGMI|nr:DNA polymerase III subunit delta [Legionella micdadei]ARG97584.1 DNA polymerase III subunit delta [Legionella micdadei]ARH00104.1 DNA polymerase III subunit delta [Legionella micdadei]KTD27664.1 DNA polymerase III, delta subunit [Legionella micdadei]NSL17648.1 DNA polymerase III subunit delta [Legionella micdadei]CEG60850.1 DNA polymerase III, delta subunit [Legionella micdadei]
MLIKLQALEAILHQKLAALYVLFGQDLYLLDQAAQSIKSAWQAANNHESEETILYVDTPSDWALLDTKANSYSLFSNSMLIDIRYEKKTIEANAKIFFTHYLQAINSSCLLLLRAPNLSLKQLQWLIDHDCVHGVQASPLNATALQTWISEQLRKKAIKFEPQIPALIYQYTQSNMYACAQAIEKLELIADPNVVFTTKLVQEQLVDQCDYQLFELADACLTQNSDKTIHLLRYAANSKVEPTLILWLLTQEIRQLIQLLELTHQQSVSFNAACNQLKIWPQKARLYQSACKRAQLPELFHLLQFCKTTDERIKSSQNNQIWQALEQIALSLCLAKQVGHFA